MFFNTDPKWLEEISRREEECGGECLVGSLPDEENQDLDECPVCGEKTLFCYQCLS